MRYGLTPVLRQMRALAQALRVWNQTYIREFENSYLP